MTAALLLTMAAVVILLSTPSQAQNEPPEAIISHPQDGSEWMVGEVVTFDGSRSTDEDVPNLTYEWDFAGQVVSGRDKALVQRVFTTPGDVPVVLTVVDTGDLSGTDAATIHIRPVNQAPVAIITTPLEGQRFLNGRSIAFDGRQSYDPDGGPLVYRWEADRFDDPLGTTDSFSIKLPLGRYRVTLFVFDQVGAAGTATVNLTVEVNQPPEMSDGSVVPRSGPYDLPGGFNFSVTYSDPDDDPPEQIRVKTGPPDRLVAHELNPTDPDDQDYWDGARFHVLVEMPPGEHVFVFTCRDLFYSCATSLHQGPRVHQLQTIESPQLDARVTINWTEVGTVTARPVQLPGSEPPGTLVLSLPVRIIIEPGVWSEARLRLGYSTVNLVEPDSINLMWFDPVRQIWVPANGQAHDAIDHWVDGDVPLQDVTMAVFGQLSPEHVNRPPNLVIKYDIRDAYVNELMMFDASCSTDPDGTVLLFYWDFVDDGRAGPWVPGTMATHVFGDEGVHQVTLMAIDGGNRHYLQENVTIRAEMEYTPGPWDNPGALFLLGTLLVIAFGLAAAYRLHTPRTYDDLFGKAYRERDEDEYSQLFRKLTQEELESDTGEEVGREGGPEGDLAGSDEGPEEGPEEGSDEGSDEGVDRRMGPHEDEGSD